MFCRGHALRSSIKLIILPGTAFLLVSIENWAEETVPISGLLAVTSMGSAFKWKSVPAVSSRLSDKFAKLWLAAELILFVLVGAAVDIRYTLHAGFPAIAMILLALLFRAAGVLLCLIGTPLSPRERLFCIIAYMPKATCRLPLALSLWHWACPAGPAFSPFPCWGSCSPPPQALSA